ISASRLAEAPGVASLIQLMLEAHRPAYSPLACARSKPPCRAGFSLVWVRPRNTYWLYRPRLALLLQSEGVLTVAASAAGASLCCALAGSRCNSRAAAMPLRRKNPDVIVGTPQVG